MIYPTIAGIVLHRRKVDETIRKHQRYINVAFRHRDETEPLIVIGVSPSGILLTNESGYRSFRVSFEKFTEFVELEWMPATFRDKILTEA